MPRKKKNKEEERQELWDAKSRADKVPIDKQKRKKALQEAKQVSIQRAKEREELWKVKKVADLEGSFIRKRKGLK